MPSAAIASAAAAAARGYSATTYDSSLQPVPLQRTPSRANDTLRFRDTDTSSNGPYAVKLGTLTCDNLPGPQPFTYENGRKLDVIYPDSANERFPVVSYLHGGGIPIASDGINGLSDIYNLYASWGFVVVAPQSCYDTNRTDYPESAPFSSLNCADTPPTPTPWSPCNHRCFGRFYELHYEAIRCTNPPLPSPSPILVLTVLLHCVVIRCTRTALASHHFPIDAAAGVAVAGHSLGAEAALYMAAYAPADILRSVSSVTMHHYGASGGCHDFLYQPPIHSKLNPPQIRVPTILWTGTQDDYEGLGTYYAKHYNSYNVDAHANQSLYVFSRAAPTRLPRGLVNKVGVGHFEPFIDGPYNPRLGYYSVAWALLYQNFSGRPTAPARRVGRMGVNWEALIFGDSPESVCGGGDGMMANCVMDRGTVKQS